MIRNIVMLGWLATMVVTTTSALAEGGVISLDSPFSVASTVDKLEAVLKSKGMTVFARINHAEGANSVDLALRPTEVLIFGNPKVGTPLMNCSQSIAIDLPQKMLAWEDETGEVHLSYNHPLYLKERHSSKGCDKIFNNLAAALRNFAKAAVTP